MTEKVRVHVGGKALATRPVGDAKLDRAMLQARAVPADEESWVFHVGERGAVAQPGAKCLDSLAAHRYDSSLSPLAQHADRAIGKVELAQVEADQFIEAQTGRVEQLHDRLVAHRQGVFRGNVEQ